MVRFLLRLAPAMNDSLQVAFGEAYLDLCREGLCLYDQRILEELWAEFIRDMKSGFSSCFDNETN